MRFTIDNHENIEDAVIHLYSHFLFRCAPIWRTFLVSLRQEQIKRIKMDKKKEQAIVKLNQIKSWANYIIMRSKKMDQILESVNKSDPDIQDLTTFIDVADARYGAELLKASIEDAIDNIERKYVFT